MDVLCPTWAWRIQYKIASIIDRSLSLKINYIETMTNFCQKVVATLSDCESLPRNINVIILTEPQT